MEVISNQPRGINTDSSVGGGVSVESAARREEILDQGIS
jgi:hypothetical protein